jgi:hypothetical protein
VHVFDRWRPKDVLETGLAIGGYAWCLTLLVVGFRDGLWGFPGGDVVFFYAPAGDALRSGGQVYIPGVLYGPPWAVAFGALSWLGPWAIHAVVLALDVVALWTIAWGNWRRLGYILWFPLVAFEIAAGQLNLLVAAALVAAQHGHVWPLAAMSLAKVWPAVGVRLRDLPRFLLWVAGFALISLPWLSLWPEWIAALVAVSSSPLGPLVPVPWVARAAIAVGLLLVRRPWTQALAAAIVSPGLYWGQLVVLVAPVSLWLARRELAPKAAVAEDAAGPGAASAA